jgi:beta-glucosidase
MLAQSYGQTGFRSFVPPVSYEEADKRAEKILEKMSLEEKIQLIGGHNFFFINGSEKYGMPQLYLSDATQGVHIRKDLSQQLERSTAFPCPLALAATWNPELAGRYAQSIGEECRAGGTAVLLGPGMNIYRISQNGRNFEYFGEDPFLAARMIEQYVAGVQSTGTIATLKHFLCNNTEHYRRKSNSIVDERTLHEIYLPAFKAGVDAGAMAVMTSYNQVNGEYTAESRAVVDTLLRKDLGFKWLVMSDWWSTYDALKTIKSGLDLEMPGDPMKSDPNAKKEKTSVKTSALALLNEGKISEGDVERMAKNIIRTTVAMGLYDRPVRDEKYLTKYPDHERTALQTARESIVLLKNENHLLPLDPKRVHKILLTGDYVEKLARGYGSAEVEGYNTVTMLEAFKQEFGAAIDYSQYPSDEQIVNADVVLISIGTDDSEGHDRLFSLPEHTNAAIKRIAAKNPHIVVLVNAGGGIQMTPWNEKVAALLYAWYPGQNGNTALAEIISGKTNPSGKLPITIEKKFEDSPGYLYKPEDEPLCPTWCDDFNPARRICDVVYREGVFVGYRWYDFKKIEPLYHFGFGLSYTTFDYSDLKVTKIDGKKYSIEFVVKNTGITDGAETAQLYVRDIQASVPRPIKELKGFRKIFLKAGAAEKVTMTLTEKDFSFWDAGRHDWFAEPGDFTVLVGSSSIDIRLQTGVVIE